MKRTSGGSLRGNRNKYVCAFARPLSLVLTKNLQYNSKNVTEQNALVTFSRIYETVLV